jgi:hypothetical protein
MLLVISVTNAKISSRHKLGFWTNILSALPSSALHYQLEAAPFSLVLWNTERNCPAYKITWAHAQKL